MTKAYTPEGYEFTAAYDAENRLKSIQYMDGASVVHKTEYIHDANGFVGIIKQYENGALIKEIRMVRDGFLEIQERDQNNNITREYAWGLNLGGGIGGLLSMRQQGQNYHYLYDGKGNVNAVLDSAQQIVASYRYDTFGKLMVKSGTLDQPFQFSTKRYDQNTGLNYYGYRFYSPALGRWINRDPIAERGGVNLYGFVGNNPVNWVDPLGLEETMENPSYWQYTQSTGQIAFVMPDGVPLYYGEGYAGGYGNFGRGVGVNDPDMESITSFGPIPRGWYQIGPAYANQALGPVTMNLTPTVVSV